MTIAGMPAFWIWTNWTFCRGMPDLDFGRNSLLKNSGFFVLDEPDFCKGILTTWILGKMTLYHPLFPGLVHENLA
ncbi:unnamed protein product [Rhizophagus irregularis]|nr:unnamed protein product [Rhizophagus irregularis]